ncbi:MAG: tRNA guanosine(34) transglycosylase Tgt, partial [Patescibacteria group bacterium]
SIEIQHAIGADIIFAFDECVSPDASYEYQKEAMGRTHQWALRSLERHLQLTTDNILSQGQSLGPESLGPEKGLSLGNRPALFGIVQGGRFEDLRKESARTIGAMDFDGFGIGGSFDKKDIDTALGWVNEILPEEKPRHLLGIGEPLDLFGAVENGCDLFDCVAPTRQARTGSLYTKHGRLNIENAKYKADFTPLEEGCECYTCKTFTCAYLAHLFRSGEILAKTLATLHNVYFIVQLVKKMRKGILDGTFFEFKEEFLRAYRA